jgi:hypothetical protein
MMMLSRLGQTKLKMKFEPNQVKDLVTMRSSRQHLPLAGHGCQELEEAKLFKELIAKSWS